MIFYIGKRIVYLLLTLLLVSFIIFYLIHLIPGDPVTAMIGDEASTEDINAFRKDLGLDKPLPTQFAIWLGKIVTGDFGTSIKTKRSISRSIRERFPVTMTLTIFATLFAILLAVPSGTMAALHHNTSVDYSFMLGAILGVSIPGFWLGLGWGF